MINKQHSEQLLRGLLAVQNGLCTWRQLLAALHEWGLDHSLAIDDILVRLGVLTEAKRGLILEIAKHHVATHGHVDQSLAEVCKNPDVSQHVQEMATATVLPGDLGPAIWQTDTLLSRQAAVLQSGLGDRFKILRKHASGGLGTVFIASDQQLRRDVALKQIRPDMAADSDATVRFIKEAEITGQLEHPGIVPVYALGVDDQDRPFYAMRFVNGETLRERIDLFHKNVQAGLVEFDSGDLRQLLRCFLDVCHAVGYAHARGVLHRDLKPSNVMLGKYGETLVVDWGLAKPYGRPLSENSNLQNRTEPPASDPETPLVRNGPEADSETAYGTIFGTPRYAAPEQIRGDLDLLCPASDVYSLGAILFEILGGGQPPLLPVSGPNLGSMAALPGPRSSNRALDVALDAVCRQAMQIEIGRRYSSVGQLRRDVEAWLDDRPLSAHPDTLISRSFRWIRKHPGRASAAAVSLLAVTMASIVTGFITNHYRGEAVRALLSEQLQSVEVARARGNHPESIAKTKALLQSSRRLPESTLVAHCRDQLIIEDNDGARATLQLLHDTRLNPETKAVIEFLQSQLSLHGEGHAEAITNLTRSIEQVGLPEVDKFYAKGLVAQTPDDCITALRQVVERDRFHHAARSRLAFTLMLAGDVEECLNECSLGSKLAPWNPQFPVIRAMVHAMQGDEDAMAMHFRQASEQLTPSARDQLQVMLTHFVDISKGLKTSEAIGDTSWESVYRGIGLAVDQMCDCFPVSGQKREDPSNAPGWRFATPSGPWVEELRVLLKPRVSGLLMSLLDPQKQLQNAIEPIANVLPRNQLVASVSGVLAFAADGEEQTKLAVRRLSAASRTEPLFPGLRRFVADGQILAMQLLSPDNVMSLQRPIVTAVVDGGLAGPNQHYPPPADLLWTILMRVGMYDQAERFAIQAIEQSHSAGREYWDLRRRRALWLRQELESLGRTAIRIKAEDLPP